jgi:hypothetical protein
VILYRPLEKGVKVTITPQVEKGEDIATAHHTEANTVNGFGDRQGQTRSVRIHE